MDKRFDPKVGWNLAFAPATLHRSQAQSNFPKRVRENSERRNQLSGNNLNVYQDRRVCRDDLYDRIVHVALTVLTRSLSIALLKQPGQLVFGTFLKSASR